MTKKVGKRRSQRPREDVEVDHDTVTTDEINEQTEQDNKREEHVHEETLQDFLASTFGEEAVEEAGLQAKDSVDESQLPAGQLPSRGWINKTFKTKSAAIRYLLSRGHSVKEISEFLGVLYQHVRNVKVTYLKRGPNEDWNLERRRITEQQGK